MRPFSLQQRDAFLEAARPYQPYSAAFAIMAKAGLRPGEAYALQPGDLDLDGRQIRVERALDLDGTIKPTKTYERRMVRLARSLVEALREHLAWLTAETKRRQWSDANWLFPTAANTPINNSRAGKVFRRVLEAAQLPHHVPYDLRHSYATLMLSRRADPAFVSRQLGALKC